MAAKSSGPSTVRILKRKYSLLAGSPSIKTTINTVSPPWKLDTCRPQCGAVDQTVITLLQLTQALHSPSVHPSLLQLPQGRFSVGRDHLRYPSPPLRRTASPYCNCVNQTPRLPALPCGRRISLGINVASVVCSASSQNPRCIALLRLHEVFAAYDLAAAYSQLNANRAIFSCRANTSNQFEIAGNFLLLNYLLQNRSISQRAARSYSIRLPLPFSSLVQADLLIRPCRNSDDPQLLIPRSADSRMAHYKALDTTNKGDSRAVRRSQTAST